MLQLRLCWWVPLSLSMVQGCTVVFVSMPPTLQMELFREIDVNGDKRVEWTEFMSK
jgi:hypothetical protein